MRAGTRHGTSSKLWPAAAAASAAAGQPYGATDEVRKQRMRGIYDHDEAKAYRCSHQNPYIKKVYTEFLEEPGSHKAHQLLHTHYTARPLFMK